jgi:hypothetical protein
MKYILYYSNFCEHCKQLLIILAKQKVAVDEISYICIDKRQQMDDGNVYAALDNGRLIPIPKNINSVPSLVLLNHGNSVIIGDSILTHFKTPNKQAMLEDPSAFSFTEMSGASDKYSYLDMSTDELSAKGSGGLRMMHDYVSLDHNQRIETPPEDEAVKTDVSMEKLMKQREGEINLNR